MRHSDAPCNAYTVNKLRMRVPIVYRPRHTSNAMCRKMNNYYLCGFIEFVRHRHKSRQLRASAAATPQNGAILPRAQTKSEGGRAPRLECIFFRCLLALRAQKAPRLQAKSVVATLSCERFAANVDKTHPRHSCSCFCHQNNLCGHKMCAKFQTQPHVYAENGGKKEQKETQKQTKKKKKQ